MNEDYVSFEVDRLLKSKDFTTMEKETKDLRIIALKVFEYNLKNGFPGIKKVVRYLNSGQGKEYLPDSIQNPRDAFLVVVDWNKYVNKAISLESKCNANLNFKRFLVRFE